MVLDTCALPYRGRPGHPARHRRVTTQGMDDGDMARERGPVRSRPYRKPADVSTIAAEVRALAERNPPYPG
ncbi:serine hydroxymethyltransferase [Streptomyces badius]